MQQALNDNEVLLWGIQVVPENLLKPYDIGNKNPKSIVQRGKPKKQVKLLNEIEKENKEIEKAFEDVPEEVEEVVVIEVVKPIVRAPDEQYKWSTYYNYFDIPFLEREKARIEKEIEDCTTGGQDEDGFMDYDEMDRLDELKDTVLEPMLTDIKGTIALLKKELPEQVEPKNIPIIPIDENKKSTSGKGFKKGSPEALEHARKMREGKLKKEIPIVETVTKKARAIKGSEEAKAIGKRLAEAKKAKKAQIAPVIVADNPIKHIVVKRPWFYIGEIPPRYREATMDEAIKHNMVSNYGKYQVDVTKNKFYKNYGIFLSFDLSDLTITTQTNAIKKRIERIDRKLDTLDIKADNQSDSSKKALLLWEINELNDERKDVIGAYNWLMKEYYYRRNMPYKKEKFIKEIPKIEEAKLVTEKPKITQTIMMNSTIKPKKTKKELMDEYSEIFVKNGIEVIIKRDFFDDNNKLKTSKAEELEKQGIILDKSFYKLEDYKRMVYVPKFFQTDDIIEEMQADFKKIVKQKKPKKSTAKTSEIKELEKPKEYEPEFFKKRTKEEDEAYYAKLEREAIERANKEEEESKKKVTLSNEELENIFRSVSYIPLVEL
jgi:hypothetical protein